MAYQYAKVDVYKRDGYALSLVVMVDIADRRKTENDFGAICFFCPKKDEPKNLDDKNHMRNET
jgi:hypothetical protein